MYETRQKEFLWGVVIGGTVATLTALLFTTKKGKQIQGQISDMYDQVEDNVKEFLSDSKNKVEEVGEEAAEKIAPKSKNEAPQKNSK